MARAIIRNAPILILDEPLRGLDVAGETKVRKGLMAGKTCLLITHSLREMPEADLVIILENGRIVERGEHGELMVRSEQYRHLYELHRRQQAS